MCIILVEELLLLSALCTDGVLYSNRGGKSLKNIKNLPLYETAFYVLKLFSNDFFVST